jgi:hypothetical protein
MPQVASRRSWMDVRRWGPYSPLVLVMIANGLELWARLSGPAHVWTAGDYFTVTAQAAVCAVCFVLWMACLPFGIVPKDQPATAAAVTTIKELDAADCVLTAASEEWAPPAGGTAAVQRRLRSGLRALPFRHTHTTTCPSRRRLRGLD